MVAPALEAAPISSAAIGTLTLAGEAPRENDAVLRYVFVPFDTISAPTSTT